MRRDIYSCDTSKLQMRTISEVCIILSEMTFISRWTFLFSVRPEVLRKLELKRRHSLHDSSSSIDNSSAVRRVNAKKSRRKGNRRRLTNNRIQSSARRSAPESMNETNSRLSYGNKLYFRWIICAYVFTESTTSALAVEVNYAIKLHAILIHSERKIICKHCLELIELTGDHLVDAVYTHVETFHASKLERQPIASYNTLSVRNSTIVIDDDWCTYSWHTLS